jgi:hypothetical protein
MISKVMTDPTRRARNAWSDHCHPHAEVTYSQEGTTQESPMLARVVKYYYSDAINELNE